MTPRVLLALAALAAGATAAQPAPLVWERVGDAEDAAWLAFDGATLYAEIGPYYDPARPHGIFVLRPGEDWAMFRDRSVGNDLGFYDGVVFTFGLSSLSRSLDGGRTFETVFDDGAQTLPFEAPGGGLLVGVNSATRAAARSDDDGATWTVPDGPDIALTPYAFAVPDAVPGRVVGAGFGGIGYSDDGGRTWAPTRFNGGISFAAWSMARVEPGPHDGGHGGSLLAILEGNGVYPRTVVRSVDGVEWADAAPSPHGYGYTGRLVAAPDGAVYLYSVYYNDSEDQSPHPVYRSRDGGTTWEDVGPVWTGWWAVPEEIELGPDGRLWAATYGPHGDPSGGVFRTTEPVYAVSGEVGPAPEAGLSLAVRPNPTAGRAVVTVALATPVAVRVAVVDALGREVALVHDGPAADGAAFEVATGTLAPGVYVVRAVSAAGTASAALTVVR